jgi:hypothetical protein
LTFNEVTSLHSEKEVLVGDSNEFLITRSPSSLVSSEGKVRVTLFAVFTNDLGVIEFVLNEEVACSFVARVDLDFGKSVVECWLLDSLVVSSFEPN